MYFLGSWPQKKKKIIKPPSGCFRWRNPWNELFKMLHFKKHIYCYFWALNEICLSCTLLVLLHLLCSLSVFHFSWLFEQNRAEYRDWGNDITGLQTNRIYCHTNGLKTQRILIASFEHVLMVKTLIYEILLSCHKRHQIFQASKGFSGRFNKHGWANSSANNIWLGKQFQFLHS